jgi:hypothetical protein
MTASRRHPPHPDADRLAAGIPEPMRTILDEAQHAPSAHNAQPWRILVDPAAPDEFELRYDFTEYLPHDPDDRDAMLGTGAYVECLALAAVRHGLRLDVRPLFQRDGAELTVCRLRLTDPASRADPPDVAPGSGAGTDLVGLAAAAVDRRTNRGRYRRTPLTGQLRAELTGLGCALVAPAAVAATVATASTLSWRDSRFVTDLAAWTRAETGAPDGMTPTGLMLARYEWWALRLAYRAGRLPGPLARLFASRDIRLLRTAPAVAVLTAPDTTPQALFDAGRRLLRAWVTVSAAGYASHPISISVDRPETRPEVARLAGAEPVAVFRIGVPRRPAPRSNRVPLAAVLRPLTPAAGTHATAGRPGREAG